MSATEKKAKKKPGKGAKEAVDKQQSIEGILLLLGEADLSPAVEWYVRRLSEIFAEIPAGKSPKVKLEILQELRDFIIPQSERKPFAELYDPAAPAENEIPPSMMYDGERVRPNNPALDAGVLGARIG